MNAIWSLCLANQLTAPGTYGEADFMRFYFVELLPLAPQAFRVYEKNIGGGILTTDFDFRVRKFEPEALEQLWCIPNQIDGVTMMKPEDY